MRSALPVFDQSHAGCRGASTVTAAAWSSNILKAIDMSTINQLEFEKSASGRRVRQVLGNRRAPPEGLLNIVRQAVMEVVPYLAPRKRYTAEELCGPDLWDAWAPGLQISAGICLAYLVRNGTVPLVMHTTPSGKGTKKYFLP
jgi:hypothetical protein